ncbi:MAG: hypothetical protein A4E28_01825 [Methanocella sp. PtaU1.Bin125]|nr:MAG: hypothetical protein A4E28_01825 [Methanocella sp. PtaU1.Bin125]
MQNMNVIPSGKTSTHATRVFFILVNVSFVLWLLSLANTHIYRFEPSAFYYIGQLDVFYWAGMVTIIGVVVAMLLTRARGAYNNSLALDIACIAMFVLYLFGTPLFIYDLPRFGDVYYVLEMTETMISGAGFGLTGAGGDLGYLNSFPGAIIYFSFVKIVSGISGYQLANYYVLFLMMLLSLLVYAIARRISGYFMLIAPICFLSLAWAQEYHLSPQSLALILYLCLWLILIIRLLGNKRSLATYFLLVMLSLSIVVSHPGTPIFILLNVAALYVVTKVLNRLKLSSVSLNRYEVMALMLPAVFWLSAVAQAYVIQGIAMLSAAVVGLSSGSYHLEYSLGMAQPDQMFVDTLRKIITVAEIAIGGLCILLLLKKESRRTGVLLGCWFASCFVFQLVAQNAVFGRFLVFALFPFAFLVSATISRAPKYRLSRALAAAAVILVIASALIIPLISYGGDYYEFMPRSRISAEQYAESKNLPQIRSSDFAGDGFLALAAEKPYNVFLTYGPQWYNFFHVKYSRGDEYAGMFNRAGQSTVYTNGEYSLQGYIIDNPS